MSDRPCIKCGKTERYRDGECASCARERRRQYVRGNREKVLETNRRWKKENPEKYQASNERWRFTNRPRLLESKKEDYRINAERNRKNRRLWQRANPDKLRAQRHRRRARKSLAGGSFTAEEWKSLCDYYGNSCLRCGRNDAKLVADHVLPIAMGGTSNIDNIQPLCGPCNSSKQDRRIDYRHRGSIARWIQKKLFDW